jgi:hypothetical protein
MQLRAKKLSRSQIAALTAILIVIITIAYAITSSYQKNQQKEEEFYLGVDIAYGNFADLKALVTEVKNYTNLIVLGLPEVSINRTLLDESCDYIYSLGLHFIVLFTNTSQYSDWQNYTPAQWVSDAKAKYGDKFVAIYRWDEAGGDQLDNSKYQELKSAGSYSEVAQKYVNVLSPEVQYYHDTGVNVVTADYGLHWFDYQAGYDTVIAEFGWNNSRQQQIALVRGAAQAHDKDWGAMITWTYTQEPYIESGPKLYDDLLIAYNNGAKYAIVFDYPKMSTANYGLLQEDHLNALKQFWNYSSSYGPTHKNAKTAYVLPADYGFGFRSASDTIWGLWSADATAQDIYNDVELLIRQKGADFDIVCNNSTLVADSKGNYSELIYWNGTKVNP